MQPTLKHRFDVFREKLFTDITSVPEVLQQSYFPGLDGLRAISIITVLLGHAFIGTWWFNYFPGTIGVNIFFVISGFLITTLLLKEKVNNGKVSFKKFYIRRFLRIFPVAYIYIYILLLLNRIFQLHIPAISFIAAGTYIMNFPIHNATTWYTGHFWSLSVEEQFYFIFPVLLVLRTNVYIIIVTTIILILPFSLMLAYSNYGFFYTVKILHNLLYFFNNLFEHGACSIFIGSILSILIFKRIVNVESFKNYYYLSFVLFVVAIYQQTYKLPGSWDFVWHDIFSIIIGVVILLNLKSKNFFLVILNNSIMIRIGVLSYSIYIWQQLFMYNQPWKDSFKYSDSLLLNFILLFFVAYFSYTFFESKFLRLKKHFKAV